MGLPGLNLGTNQNDSTKLQLHDLRAKATAGSFKDEIINEVKSLWTTTHQTELTYNEQELFKEKVFKQKV